MTSYAEFLARKQKRISKPGRQIRAQSVNPLLHPWQNRITRWALKTSRAAIWADTGMGKTLMQLEWARLAADTSLVVAPLAVCDQTVREAEKLGITTRYVKYAEDVTGPGIWVTNYERVPNIPAGMFDAVVLDESSILKQADGKTRLMLINHFAQTPHRLACSATPAPNDPEELTSQAEWLGQMTRVNMLASYFIHDQDGWRLKGHAHQPMIRWMAQWAVALRKPSDVGGDDTDYTLPGLVIVPEIVPYQTHKTIGGVTGRAQMRRETLDIRVKRTVELVYDCNTPKQTRIHDSVLPSKQRQVETYSRETSGEKSETTRTISERQRISRSNEPTGGRIAEKTSIATPSMDIQNFSRRDRVDDRRGMSSVPRKSACRPEGEDAHRSRPSNRHNPRCSLSIMQSSTGPSGRRSDTCDGDVRLHYACRDQWIIWCGLNDEQDALIEAFGSDCRSIDGRTHLEKRIENIEAWRRGEFRILLVKPGMYSFGANFQHCSRMAFVGLGDSYEQYYQAIRRCYRYGQKRVVHAHVVVSEPEAQIADNVARKEQRANKFTSELVAEMQRTWKG